MKKYVTLLLLVLFMTLSFAQNNYQDVVYLKNGSIIRGVIIENVPNKSIKIETADKSVFVFQMNEIEKLVKEKIEESSSDSYNNSGLNSGYKGTIELGYQIGTGDYGMDRVKLDMINAYQFNPYFSLGLGTGFRYYFDAEALLIPVFVDFRVNLLDQKVSPYLALGVGYSLDATNDFQGVGLLFNPSTGVSFKVSDNSVLNVGLGYEMQKMDFLYGDYYGYYSSSESSGAISVNVGVSF